jgi:hypothetical protein
LGLLAAVAAGRLSGQRGRGVQKKHGGKGDAFVAKRELAGAR